MERLRRRSAAHLHITGDAKKMMMRSRLGELLLRLDADTTEVEADAASNLALLTRMERGPGAPDGAVGSWCHAED
jgi:hypothetical protein